MVISNIGDEPYVVFIPNPEQGTYTFQVTGTGDGTYTMTTLSIDDSGEGSPPTTITGTAMIGKTDTHLITYSLPIPIVNPPPEAVPEFPTIALPVLAIIGLMFLFQRKKGK